MSSSLGRGWKSVVPVVVIGLLLAFLSADGARAQGFQENEPNNVPSRATVLPLTTISATGVMDQLGDVDYWTTEMVQGNLLRVQLAGMTGEFQGRVEILNNDPPLACQGGFNDDATCTSDLDCRVRCISNTCVGGPSDGLSCVNDGQCADDDGLCTFEPIESGAFQCSTGNIRTCDPAALACNDGFMEAVTCTADADCIETPFCAPEMVECIDARCVGGSQEGTQCNVAADCETRFEVPTCVPVSDTSTEHICAGEGENDGGSCDPALSDPDGTNPDCPPKDVCVGGQLNTQECPDDGNCMPQNGTCSVFDSDGECGDVTAFCTMFAEAERPNSGSPSTTAQALITASTPPGQGLIRVTNDILAPGSIKTFTYILNVTQGRPEVEPNDDPGTAQPLPITSEFPILGLFPSRGEHVDLYELVVDTDQTVFVALDYSTTVTLPLGITLFDSEGEEIQTAVRTNISGSNQAKNPSIVLAIEAGTYYVQVFRLEEGISVFDINYSLFVGGVDGNFEQEPNQSFAEAIQLTVTPGGEPVTFGGLLQSGQDIDVYKVNVPAGRMLIADMDSTSPVQVLDGVVSGFLEEDRGIAFVSNDDSSFPPAGSSFALVNQDGYIRTVPPRGGEIFLAVGDLLNRGGVLGFRYELRVRIVDAPRSESEPNQSVAQANHLASNEVIRGDIDFTSDVDIYTIEGNAGETLLANVNAFGLGSFLDARMIIRDSAGTLLADRSSSAFSLDPFVLLASLPADDTYSIEIRRRSGTSGSGPSYFYELIAQTAPSLDAVVSNPDVDGSTRVDGFDLAELSRRFGTSAGDPGYSASVDLLRDDVIDGSDLAVLANFFGSTLPPGVNLETLIADTQGDALGFFGPTEAPVDIVGIGSNVEGGNFNLTTFFARPVSERTAAVVSIDIDASTLTGSLGTPDAYVVQNNLGSEIELLLDADQTRVFSIPDSRTDVFGAFEATVGASATDEFSRDPLQLTVLGTFDSAPVGNAINTQLPLALLGGTTAVNLAVLGVAADDVEPTDRLPNVGKVSLAAPFTVTSITASQIVCDGLKTCSDDPDILCVTNSDCNTGARCTTSPPLCIEDQACSNDPLVRCDPADPAASCGDPGATCQPGTVCPAAPVECLDVDDPSAFACSNNPSIPCDPDNFSPITTCFDFTNRATCNNQVVPSSRVVYLRTLNNPPVFTDFERSIAPSIAEYDNGGLPRNNDFIDRIFPLGTRPLSPSVQSNLFWFTRDQLYNFGVRDALFDKHSGDIPPPDTDLYYFIGAEEDRVVVDVSTEDDGATFDSRLELLRTPLRLSSLDPSSNDRDAAVSPDDLVLLAQADDRDPADLDPLLEFDLETTGIYVVRVAASPKQTTFPATNTPYKISLRSLRTDEIALPLVIRGPYSTSAIVRGLSVMLQFDPNVLTFTGFDLAQGTRMQVLPTRVLATAQEYAGQVVLGAPGQVQIAVRSFTSNLLNQLNGLGGTSSTGFDSSEIVIGHARFRAIGAGSTEVRFLPVPTTPGEPLPHLAITGSSDRAPIFQPLNGYGPGVRVTVEGN